MVRQKTFQYLGSTISGHRSTSTNLHQNPEMQLSMRAVRIPSSPVNCSLHPQPKSPSLKNHRAHSHLSRRYPTSLTSHQNDLCSQRSARGAARMYISRTYDANAKVDDLRSYSLFG